MKVHFIFLIFFLSFGKATSQELSNSELVKKQINSPSTSKMQMRGLFKLYKVHFSNQILNDCIYDQSCSAFSQGAFQHYGLLKGAMLTADRLTRCNRATHAEMSSVRFDRSGRVKDHWEDYGYK
jgi:putative component of membrane protein insertase Oxa1/YidC/SpoIIIJ protein YidD